MEKSCRGVDSNFRGRGLLDARPTWFKGFVYERGLHLSSSWVSLWGGVLGSVGLGAMGFSRRLETRVVRAPLLFRGGVVIALVGMTALYGGSQVREVENYIQGSHDLIEEYEQSGDYRSAVGVARSSYAWLLKVGSSKDASVFFEEGKRLEGEVLALGASRRLFDERYQPKVTLLKVLEFAGMEPLVSSERAVLQINNWAQKHLLRQGERWEEQTTRFEELKPSIKPLLRDLGFIDATIAQFEDYEGALVHGGLLPRVRLRLHYLVKEWERGVRVSRIYFLSGERPLDPGQEGVAKLIEDKESPLKIRKGWLKPSDFPKTEREMVELVWEQSEIPADMRSKVEVYFINAPMKNDAKGERRVRPTTDDTVETWLKTSPPQGRYLAITNAPYTNRQDLVVRAIAPSEYGIDTIGPGLGEKETMAIVLDELARSIFQAKQFSEKARG